VRFVLDTNLLVSGVIAAGLPRRLVDGAKAIEFELCTSEVLLAELLDVLSRGKFAARLSQAGLTPQGIVDDLRRLAVVVSPAEVPRVVPTDPDDDHVIAAAVAARPISSPPATSAISCRWAASKVFRSSPRGRPSSGWRQGARLEPEALRGQGEEAAGAQVTTPL
jgi:putative PIN family toxin of toxin-antitoxin system